MYRLRAFAFACALIRVASLGLAKDDEVLAEIDAAGEVKPQASEGMMRKRKRIAGHRVHADGVAFQKRRAPGSHAARKATGSNAAAAEKKPASLHQKKKQAPGSDAAAGIVDEIKQRAKSTVNSIQDSVNKAVDTASAEMTVEQDDARNAMKAATYTKSTVMQEMRQQVGDSIDSWQKIATDADPLIAIKTSDGVAEAALHNSIKLRETFEGMAKNVNNSVSRLQSVGVEVAGMITKMGQKSVDETSVMAGQLKDLNQGAIADDIMATANSFSEAVAKSADGLKAKGQTMAADVVKESSAVWDSGFADAQRLSDAAARSQEKMAAAKKSWAAEDGNAMKEIQEVAASTQPAPAAPAETATQPPVAVETSSAAPESTSAAPAETTAQPAAQESSSAVPVESTAVPVAAETTSAAPEGTSAVAASETTAAPVAVSGGDTTAEPAAGTKTEDTNAAPLTGVGADPQKRGSALTLWLAAVLVMSIALAVWFAFLHYIRK